MSKKALPETETNSQWRELLLLGLLRQQEMHGYRLNEFLTHDLATCTDLKKSTAYFLLERMARAGWVSEASAQEGNRPPRKVYRLTEAGEAAFQRMLRENLANHFQTSFGGDAGLAYLDLVPPAEGRALLTRRRAAIQAALEAVQAVPTHHGSFGLVLEHQAAHLQAELDWLDRVIEKIN